MIAAGFARPSPPNRFDNAIAIAIDAPPEAVSACLTAPALMP
ncbi:hypothetical protein ABU614_06575 [Lysobacter firmicutimachus]|uniref:Uncharacterized protein n=1 Tax=Lysobacter firmicutimachus TaxID=1792846 RepID=A0AAU8MZ04_9GAMM